MAYQWDDGKSARSSFFGGQQQPIRSGDPGTPYSPGAARERKDSSSTFFGRNVDEYSPQNVNYNAPPRSSYSDSRGPAYMEPLKGGRDEEEAEFNIYDDFNNVGPRYATLTGGTNNKGYRPIATPEPISKAASSAYNPQVELVTVPALGPEWKAEELRDMTKAGKREKREFKRRKAWTEWTRDQRGLCGIPWLTRKLIVWSSFFFFVALGLVLVFTIPRIPDFGFNDDTPLNYIGGTPEFNRSPANFSFMGGLDLQVDTHSSFVPVHFNYMRAQMWSSDTGALVGSGDLGPWTFKAKKYTPVTLPMNFTYAAPNTSDTTWTLFYDSCKNKQQFSDGVRPSLKLRLILTFTIRGLIGTKGASTTMTDVACPVELAVNAG